MDEKIIITCAVTGSVHVPSMSPYLPLTPAQIAADAIAAVEAGAAIVHLHARNPEDGRPTGDAAVFRQFVPQIEAATNAVINITTGGSSGMTMDQRLEGALAVSPEMASCNMGSMNFGAFPIVETIKEFKYPWERDHLLSTRQLVFRNTFEDIEEVVTRLGQGHGTRFEFECYDTSHLYTLKHFVDSGLISGPLYIQFVMGVLGGTAAEVENLIHLRRIADSLFGGSYEWSILGAGKHQIPMAVHAVLMGGNVRVGLEDSLYLRRGELAANSAAQVRRIRGLIEELGYEVATPDEARERLKLKGRNKSAALA